MARVNYVCAYVLYILHAWRDQGYNACESEIVSKCVSHAECVRVGSSGYRYAKHEATWGVWEHAPPLRSVLRLFLGTELVVLLTDDLVGIYVCAAKVSTSYKHS